MTPSAAGSQASEGLESWLAEQQVALAFSTYRTNRLLLLGRGETGGLRMHERLFDRPMGLFAEGESLWMASRAQIWRLDNHLAAGLRHEGGDRLYVPAYCAVTGDVNAHELVVPTHGPWAGQTLFVNTAFSCLAGLERGSSFAPRWQPPFLKHLAPDDACHLNGVALQDGAPAWATACGHHSGASSWRKDRRAGGVVLHLPSDSVVATGLSMPHSPRWHQDRLWLLNSGGGELGWIGQGRFQPLCALPGFTRGLAFVGNYAVVGLSKLRSPQLTGLALDERLPAEGHPAGRCGMRVIDLASGEMLHSLDLPEPIDELCVVVALPGVRQPRALGLQGEEIECLLRLPDRPEQVRVRPLAPSGKPQQEPKPPVFGLPRSSLLQGAGPAAPAAQAPSSEPAPVAEPAIAAEAPPVSGQGNAREPAVAVGLAPSSRSAVAEALVPDPAEVAGPIRYQRVFHLTPANLAPYAALTYPSLAPGSSASERISGELLGLSAMAAGAMVAFAIAERGADGGARLLSLMVAPAWRRRGIGTGLLARLMGFLASEGIPSLSVRYTATSLTRAALEPILARLGWEAPHTDHVLLEGRAAQLATVGWADRQPITAPYSLLPWGRLRSEQLQAAAALEAPAELLPPAMNPLLPDPLLSLALLHHQAPVGWLLAQRSGPGAVRYSSLYLAKAHRGQGRALAMLHEGFRRQHAAALPIAHAVIDSRDTALLRLLRRHLGAHLRAIGQSRFSQSPLAASR
ncbi:MAG: TIGR03032 family protein [Cyanobacteriota bacterium]